MGWLGALHLLIAASVGMRILLRPNRTPDSRAAWLLIVILLPLVGAVLYVLLGETDIGARRLARLRRIEAELPPAPPLPKAQIAEGLDQVFALGRSVSHFAPLGGNQAELLPEGVAVTERMIADIDAARDHVHVLFYIWLDDDVGQAFGQALMRAAARGVTCRAIVDGLGSRALTRSRLWAKMGQAGVKLAVALRPGNPFLPWRYGRIDLRNHRKIVVIDHVITYCGSQNCCNPKFFPKQKYGPWVDAVMRFTGPVARQNQRLFCTDWAEASDEGIGALLDAAPPPPDPAPGGFVAQVIATGPTARVMAMPQAFSGVIDAARDEVIITTPYFVPDGALLSSICRAGWRGVDVTLIVPARNDDFAVAAASRSFYQNLLAAGVRIHEFAPGLLHTKSITVDGVLVLIGSANMDRRSFDLNYENNILLADHALAEAMRTRQQSYIARSREVTMNEVARYSIPRRLWNNALAIAGPLL
ncbi:MAG: cardiolipin synthase [Paracoccus sp. (in: a-proteobacteria)]|nr:cardiolipin synthase [Paracoccus sp. (in: a-proteobacteria)]